MIKAITIDFWNTIVDTSNGDIRKHVRNNALAEALSSAGIVWDEERIENAYRLVYETFESRWWGERRTMSASECLEIIWREMKVTIPSEVHLNVVQAFEESILLGIPNLHTGASEVIPVLAEKYGLAVISDTAFSPGHILRQVLQKHRIYDCFSAFIFSDELGVAKPDELSFKTALQALGAEPFQAAHIGDIERTDIAGAKALGMKAILFTGDEKSRQYNGHSERTMADAIAKSWREIPGIIASWDDVEKS